MQISSPAFQNGDTIPRQYTCDGDDYSPPLAWSDLPEGTQELELLVEDPDAPGGTWTHWILTGLDPHTNGLNEAVHRTPSGPAGAHQGLNDFQKHGYGGPCPPSGKPHHYVFRLFALRKKLDLPDDIGRAQLLKAIKGSVLAEAKLTGVYRRPG